MTLFLCPFDIDSDTQTSLFSSGSLLYICKYIGSLHVNEVRMQGYAIPNRVAIGAHVYIQDARR